MTITRRTFGLGAAAVMALPFGATSSLRAMTAGTPEPLWFVNPELRAAAGAMQQMTANAAPFSAETLAAMRKGMSAMARPVRSDVPFVKRSVPGARGAPDVDVYVVNAKPGASRGGIVHTHGGGFVAGSALASIRDLQDLARTLDCAILTVEYRLAPEATWAGSVEDNYAALTWLHAHARDIGVDRTRIAVMGESAGGGHAALLAITARDRREIPVMFQSLTYPMLDDRTASTRPVPPPIGTILWDAKANRFGWHSFLGQQPGGASVPVAAVPSRTQDLAGLPPAWIGVGSIDLFVSEDIDYARRLIEAGVPAELTVVPGAFHGFDVIAADTSVAKRFASAKTEALRRAFMT